MNILNNILRYVANDGCSAFTAAKIKGFAEEGCLPADISCVLRDLNPKDERFAHMPLAFRFMKKASVFFVALILPMYYFLTILAFLPCFLLGVFRGREYEESMSKEAWEILFSHWGKYPNAFLTKALELYYLRQELIEQPHL